METFKDYAYYYNLFYQDKDYQGESKTVIRLLEAAGIADCTILNMGCGTGRHDFCMEQLGYQINGIDISPEMIAIANEKCEKNNAKCTFEVADIREYRNQKKYGAVIALFHVMSYQNSNKDIIEAMRTAGAHLEKGGIFLFDAWYGPGVLTDRPCNRIKKIDDKSKCFIRFAAPQMYPNENIVDVHYEVLVVDKETMQTQSIEEEHYMRYFFKPEIELMLNKTGFELIQMLACDTLQEADFESWTVYFVARKVE